MQSQEGQQQSQQYEAGGESVRNMDPREQEGQQRERSRYEYSEHAYRDGYPDQSAFDDMFQRDEKLQPLPKKPLGVGGILAFIALLCVCFIFSYFLHVLSFGIAATILVLLIAAGAIVTISNWRVVITPLPIQTFQVQEHAQLSLYNPYGSIAIRKGEQHAVTVTGTTHASGLFVKAHDFDVKCEQVGDRIVINGENHWSPIQFGIKRIDLEITVPQQADLQVKNGSGRIDIQDVHGEIRLFTGSGDVEVGGLQGKIEITTGSGSMTANQLDGSIKLKTGSGRMTVNQLHGTATLKTGSGPISAHGLAGQAELTTGSGAISATQSLLAGSTAFKTGSGAIVFSGTLDALGDYRFHTGSGGVDLTLAPQTAFSLDASTGSGAVSNDFGGSAVGNGPRSPIIVRTGSGPITIRRAY